MRLQQYHQYYHRSTFELISHLNKESLHLHLHHWSNRHSLYISVDADYQDRVVLSLISKGPVCCLVVCPVLYR